MDVTALRSSLEHEGLPESMGRALETMVSATDSRGLFCVGDRPTAADLMVVPQLSVARRFGVDVAAYKRLLHIEARCLEMAAFSRAEPA